jgi:hypothetical protein
MVVVLTYWLSYEYVRDPRRALEPESAAAALSRGAYHVLSLLMPYLEPQSREHLHTRSPAPTAAATTDTFPFPRRQPMAKWTAFPYDDTNYAL